MLRPSLLLCAAASLCAAETFSFQLSIPQPASHQVHVELRCDALAGEFHDFKMPAWMPGYYLIDYAKNVANFRAEDTAGRALRWEKVARNTREMDYAKYFAYAGLDVQATAAEGKGAYLGVNAQAQEVGLAITEVAASGPAQKAGLRAQDQILEVDGVKATVKVLSDALTAKKPGDKIRIKTARGENEILLDSNPQWSYTIRPSATPTASQNAIFASWMRRQ